MNASTKSHPPVPRLALRVGVTGHRLQGLQKAGYDEVRLRAAIRYVLSRMAEKAREILKRSNGAYAGESPILRVISPLAEGSDRLVAEEGIALGYELQSPLPFPPEEYKKDEEAFTVPDSKQAFDRLLSRTSSVFELDGSSAKEQAYEDVGRIVLRQSDVLIAIWDGEASKGRGGTAQIVKEAISSKIPVIWIKPTSPHASSVIQQISHEGTVNWIILDEIDTRLLEILVLDPKNHPGLERFLSEEQPRFRAALLYRIFCRTFVWGWKLPAIKDLRINDFQKGSSGEWLTSWRFLPSPNTLIGRQVERSYRVQFDWSDVMADLCADRYRSSFVLNYLFGAFAVLAAFLGSQGESLPGLDPAQLPAALGSLLLDHHDWFVVELVTIFGILILVRLNRLGNWHERWIDYRLLAEGLRQMKTLAPFARVTPAFEVPAHLGEDNPSATWFNWYFRAMIRKAGLVSAKIEDRYLERCWTVLKDAIEEQIGYHTKNEKRHKTLHHRLHRLSLLLFSLTLVACLLHLDFPIRGESVLGRYADGISTLFAIVFPAFGAAIQGILHQGELERIARRSRAIKNRLTGLRDKLGDQEKDPSFRDLGRLTETFCEIQILEQADWRSMFITKEVSPP